MKTYEMQVMVPMIVTVTARSDNEARRKAIKLVGSRRTTRNSDQVAAWEESFAKAMECLATDAAAYPYDFAEIVDVTEGK